VGKKAKKMRVTKINQTSKKVKKGLAGKAWLDMPHRQTIYGHLVPKSTGGGKG
jgi:hypothetical protein